MYLLVDVGACKEVESVANHWTALVHHKVSGSWVKPTIPVGDDRVKVDSTFAQLSELEIKRNLHRHCSAGLLESAVEDHHAAYGHRETDCLLHS